MANDYFVPSAATSTINGVRGWESRYIYHFGNFGDADDVDLIGGGPTIEDNIFETIEDNFSQNRKGTFVLPEYYLTTGKHFVIKGYYVIYIAFANGDQNLNMQSGIVYGNNTVTPLAACNDSAKHIINDNNMFAVPIEFELNYLFKVNENEVAVKSFGHMVYNAGFKTDSTNDVTYYVPIWNLNGLGNQVEYIKQSGGISLPIKFHISFTNSDADIQNIKLQHLTIQEII